MRLSVTLSLFLFLPCLAHSDDLYMYINAKSGLNLRVSPNTTSGIVTSIPYCEKVKIIETGSQSITIDGFTSNWVKVNWKNKAGWLFGGYLIANLDDKNVLVSININKGFDLVRNDSKYIFKPERVNIIDTYESIYTVKSWWDYKGGECAMNIYSAWIMDNSKWKEIYHFEIRDLDYKQWSLSEPKLIVRNVNNDQYADLIILNGGCCSQPVHVDVYLGLPGYKFSKTPVSRSTELSYEQQCDEDFVYDPSCQHSTIRGLSFENRKRKVAYEYVYDCKSNKFIKK